MDTGGPLTTLASTATPVTASDQLTMSSSSSAASSAAAAASPATNSATNHSAITGKPAVVVLTKQRLQQLVNEIDPSEQLEDEVEDLLLQMTDDFVESLVSNSSQLAKHRGARALDVKDVQLVLEKNYNMYIPGFGQPSEQLNKLKSRSSTTEAHKQRMALIKKMIKKF